MCAYGLSSKLEMLQARESTFAFQRLHSNEKVDSSACSVFNFEDKAYAHIIFFVRPIEKNKKAYKCLCFIFKIGDAANMQIYMETRQSSGALA